MATMTSQHGRYLCLKYLTGKNFGDPHFLFHKMIYFSILNYFHDLKKILSWQKKVI